MTRRHSLFFLSLPGYNLNNNNNNILRDRFMRNIYKILKKAQHCAFLCQTVSVCLSICHWQSISFSRCLSFCIIQFRSVFLMQSISVILSLFVCLTQYIFLSLSLSVCFCHSVPVSLSLVPCPCQSVPSAQYPLSVSVFEFYCLDG